MNCNMAKQLMADYLMGMTDEEINRKFDEHLKKCESCQKQMNELIKAEQKYDNKDATDSLKKVKKEINKHKRGRILAIICAVLLASITTVFVIGELRPESSLPSITKIKYKKKAEKIIEKIFDNDMDDLMDGTVSYLTAGTDSFPYTRQECLSGMIEDYGLMLEEMNKDFFYGKEYMIEKNRVSYRELYKSVSETVNLPEESDKGNGYMVLVEVSTELGNFSVNISFFNTDNYHLNIYANSSNSGDDFFYKIQDMNAMFVRLDLFASGMDYNPYIMNDRLLKDNYGNGFVGVVENFASVYGQEISDDTYINGFNKRLEEIYNTSCTESVNMEIRDYNFEKHAINIEMIWIIRDMNGYEAVMIKDLLYGYHGYQKLNDEAKIIAEDGFDEELKKKMMELF